MPDPLTLVARVAVAEARRLLLVHSRYRIEFVGTLVTLYGAFFLLRALAAHIALPAMSFGGDLAGAVLLYALWMWSYGIVGSVQAAVSADLATGAIEPLLASGLPGRWLALGRAAGFALQSGLVSGVLVVAVLAAAPARPGAIAWGAVVLAYGCCFVTAAGFAMVFAGLVLVFRRVSVLMTPVSVLLMAAMMSPPSVLDLDGVRALPFVAPKLLLAHGVDGVFDPAMAARALVGALLVGALGVTAYEALERRARATGQLSIA
jgi:hypothetical protein